MTKEAHTIYLSCCEGSVPHRVYLDMRAAFWEHHHDGVSDNESNFARRPQVKVERLDGFEIDPYIYSDNESNNAVSSKQDSQEDKISSSDMPPINKLQPGPHSIPMSIDIATQFNSDMNILIEQNSKDSSIINIKFGGPIHGNVEGSGNMPRSNFMSLLNEKITNKVVQELSKSNIKVKPQPVTKGKPSNDTKTKSQAIVQNSKTTKSSSIGSEESIEYFVSKVPTQPIIKNQNEPNIGIATENVIMSSEVLLTTKTSSDSKPSNSSIAEYNAPFSKQPTFGSKFTSFSIDNMKHADLTTPAVLSKCIIQRITKAMINDLNLKKKSSSIMFDLEKKIASLNFLQSILDQNWHSAIKRGKIMIGEIVELIITVNIDNITKKLEDINSILENLKSELINSCFYLISMTDENEKNDILCMQLIIDIVVEEIVKLNNLAEEWIRLGCKQDFSTFFINTFTLTFSPNNSEVTGNISFSKTASGSLESESKSVTKTKSRGSQQEGEIKEKLIIQKQASKEKDIQLNSQMKSSKDSIDNAVSKMKNYISYPDPSIITNSRVKKTMYTIMQVAIEENLANVNLPKSTRSKALTVQIIDEQPIITRNLDTSLIKELTNINEKWVKPIETGKMSIQDLIEFIINTISQGQELSKKLYDHVVEEMELLEKEMLFSLANNLYVSRNSDNDLMSLSYEILAELIFEEITIAKYLFQSLDSGTINATTLPLGKLYRTYIAQSAIPYASVSTIHSFKNTENYAHQTSEVKNYENISIEEKNINPQNPVQKSDSRDLIKKNSKDSSNLSKPSKSQSKSDSIAKKPVLKNSKSQISEETVKRYKETETIEENFTKDESNALIMIIDKLNIQTSEINKIKENLQTLTGKVDEKFSQWKCNFSLDKVNEYCSHNNKVHLAESSKILNTQEIVHPSEDTFSSIQPSVHKPIAKVHSKVDKSESTSYIAPISSKSDKQPITSGKKHSTTLTESLSTNDILKLIAEGSLNLLHNRNISRSKDSEDSCMEINIEFDKIFEWIVEKYEETIGNMLQTQEGLKFINSMNSKPMEEKRKTEKELITKIIQENDAMINNWVKEICYKRLLNCLTPQKNKS